MNIIHIFIVAGMHTRAKENMNTITSVVRVMYVYLMSGSGVVQEWVVFVCSVHESIP